MTQHVVRKVGVVGAGQMGSGIAQVAAQAGIDVVLLDAQQAFADRGKQKIAEARTFAAGIGAEVIVYDDQSDGFLHCTDELAARLARDIRTIRPDLLLAHWGRSMHTDHEQASLLAERARFLAANANVPMMIIAVGSGERIGRVLPELGALLRRPLITLERVRVCKRVDCREAIDR